MLSDFFELNFTTVINTNKYLFLICLLIAACRADEPIIDIGASGYPNDVGKIILTKCATPGCHNATSKDASGGFNLSSWDHLFEGGRNGSSIIPYRTDQSFFLFFINTYP